jgi:hypothetical protein
MNFILDGKPRSAPMTYGPQEAVFMTDSSVIEARKNWFIARHILFNRSKRDAMTDLSVIELCHSKIHNAIENPGINIISSQSHWMIMSIRSTKPCPSKFIRTIVASVIFAHGYDDVSISINLYHLDPEIQQQGVGQRPAQKKVQHILRDFSFFNQHQPKLSIFIDHYL